MSFVNSKLGIIAFDLKKIDLHVVWYILKVLLHDVWVFNVVDHVAVCGFARFYKYHFMMLCERVVGRDV